MKETTILMRMVIKLGENGSVCLDRLGPSINEGNDNIDEDGYKIR